MNSSVASKGRLVSLADQLRSTRQPGQVVLQASVDAVSPNPRQPRKTLNPKRMEELAGSVRKNGIKQPIRVTLTSPGQYELVSGERRWRAAKMAGLKEVPAIVDDKTRRSRKAPPGSRGESRSRRHDPRRRGARCRRVGRVFQRPRGS